MKAGIITDHAPLAAAGGADILVICQGLRSAGGGTTPTLGLLEECCPRRPTGAKMYALVRPDVGHFIYREHQQNVMLRDIAAMRKLAPPLSGVFVGCQTADGDFDSDFGTRIVRAAEGMEVWYHRGSSLLRDLENSMNLMKKAGFAGLVLGLHAAERDAAMLFAETASKVGLRVFVHGPIADLDWGTSTIEARLDTSPQPDQHTGALLPWQEWDIVSALWMNNWEVKN